MPFTYNPQQEYLLSLLYKTELLHIDNIVMKSTLLMQSFKNPLEVRNIMSDTVFA